jgi:hypothetical protein
MMAITTFAESPTRKAIAFVGPIPKEAAEAFESRGFEVIAVDSTLPIDDAVLQRADSVFIIQSTGMTRLAEITRVLNAYASPALAHDCRVYVQPLPMEPGKPVNDNRQKIVNTINALNLPAHAYSMNAMELSQFIGGRTTVHRKTLGPFIYVVPNPCGWGDVANIVKNNPAGFAANTSAHVEFSKGYLPPFSAEIYLLIQRAFHDCSKVTLSSLGNGRSGALTFRAFVERRDNVLLTKWPYGFFVKLDLREKVVKEHYNYQESALGHVPFHLGPRLKLERCCLGHNFGILVSDYVSSAEALRDCARDGRGATAVGNLFATTIASWRSGARPVDTNLAAAVTGMGEAFPTNIPVHRRPYFQAYGLQPNLLELGSKLQATRLGKVLMGVIHGDLHATNVLVRGTDAIIIDFERINFDGPLLYDAASLEAGLLVDGFRGDARKGAEVLASIRAMYTKDALVGDPTSCLPTDGSSWFFECVRQIRLHAKAMEIEPFQYAWMLAFVLAKKGCKDLVFNESQLRPGQMTRNELRAIALILAEEIVSILPRPQL